MGINEILQIIKNKRILITGHTGFKGTWLCQMIIYLGGKVYGLSKKDEFQEFYNKVKPKIEKEYFGDIRDYSFVDSVICKVNPEVIIHLASHSTIDKEERLTHYIFETNTMGVVNILESCRKNSSVQAILVVTSDKCYKNIESPMGYVETNEIGAQDPYSTSKAIQELITECYRKSYLKKNNVRVATARASNVVGGGDYHYDRLFPSAMRSLIIGEEVNIRNPFAVRPWQNVLDVLDGYILLVCYLLSTDSDNYEICSSFNFGPNEDGFVNVENAITCLGQYFTETKIRVSNNDYQVKETGILKLNSDKAKQILGWKPSYSFTQTMQQVAEFAKAEAVGKDTRELCEELIKNHRGNKNV